ncbi:helix-hairpin-helix domain-containing protein [Verrucomicrobium spinosum]|uniref:helix-hairpin-helix domain-containing protein n=1 Tax=Verrucomicrobium spinosum TaxID=2736 RepID=UPI000A7F92A7|nr:helix-hairpin-helix domain-containing protein [Verrucomicrobium spinosum]
MTAEVMATVLRNIALLLDLKGENPFKTRAYNTGAEIVETFSGDIVARAAANDLKGVKGLGDALQQKLNELASTGKLEFYERLRGEFPEGILELYEVQGLGGKKIKVLWEQLQVGTLADLKAACESGAVAKLAGFGEKTAAKILESLAFRESHADEFRLEQVLPRWNGSWRCCGSIPTCRVPGWRAATAGPRRRCMTWTSSLPPRSLAR